MKNTLNDKVAIITGATGGIGSKIAEELYNLGANIVLTGRKEASLNEIKNKLYQTDASKIGSVTCFPIDLSNNNAAANLVTHTISEFGRINILVNNAAMLDAKLFLKTSTDFMNQMLQINFLAPMQLMQMSIPYMLRSKYGRIINITSLAYSMGDAGMSAYAATKGALTSLSKTVAAEYARREITINCIAPGLIETNALHKFPVLHREDLKKQIPANRYGRPEEIASLVGFLASQKASYINGQVIHVNGGLYK